MPSLQEFPGAIRLKGDKPELVSFIMPDHELNSSIAKFAITIEKYDRMLIRHVGFFLIEQCGKGFCWT